MHEVDQPDVIAEVSDAHRRYQQALVANDAKTLIALFWNDSRAVRFGITENLYGIEEISAFRASRSSEELDIELVKVVITGHGRDVATSCAEFRFASGSQIGRQTQTWIRTADGWRIAAAHVSLMAAEPS